MKRGIIKKEIDGIEKVLENKKPIDEKTTRDDFIIVLALISILGFIGIISQTIFLYNISGYIESFWIVLLGAGLLIETNFRKLKSINNGLSAENSPHLINVVIGVIAVLAGIFSLPFFNISNPAFHSIRGILSLMAIVIIVVETWIIRKKRSSNV